MLNLLIPAIVPLIDKFIPDKDEANRIAHEIATLTEKQAHEIAKEQIKVNQEEAKNHSLFVSGWRPAVGWVCVIGMFVNFIVVPFTDIAPLDLSEMMPVLLGMLGLGTLRTFEKHKGVHRKK